MMAAAEIAFWLLTAATLQALLPTWGHLGEPAFPVLPGVVLYVAVFKKPVHFIWTATVAGVMEDALSLAPFGCSSVAFLAGGGLAMLLAAALVPVLFALLRGMERGLGTAEGRG